MRLFAIALLAAGTAVCLALMQPALVQSDLREPAHEAPHGAASTALELAATPIHFEPIRGQAGGSAAFLSRGVQNTVLITPTGLQIDLPPVTHLRPEAGDPGAEVELGISFLGADPDTRIVGVEDLPGKSNYFVGARESWRTGVPHYRKVRYERIYPGIDLVLYGNQGELEYDFVVAPGADPGEIRLRFEGAEGLRLDADGNLVVSTSMGEIIQRAPSIYQRIGKQLEPVAGGYRIVPCELVADGDPPRKSEESGTACAEIRLTVGSYVREEELIIDPVLEFSTFLGGSIEDVARDIAVDAYGFVYVAGYTTSTDFPTISPVQGNFASTSAWLHDVFVTKLDPSGQRVIYSTYLGGVMGDHSYGIFADATGNAYVVGSTQSSNFPTANAYQPQFGGLIDAFVTKLSGDGSLVFSTFLGKSGDDKAIALDVDSSGSIYFAGETSSSDFPTVNPAQGVNNLGTKDAFISKFNPTATSLAYSTFLGGAGGSEYATGVAADGQGSVYVTGETRSSDFPTLNALSGTMGGSSDAFVAKLDTVGSAAYYSTFLGGTGTDTGDAIALGRLGNTYLAGYTGSSDFPTINAYDGSLNGTLDLFVAELNWQGSALTFATYLGGSGNESNASVAKDAVGNIYVAAYTGSFNFPTVRPIQPSLAGLYDATVTIFTPSGDNVSFSTFIGGSSQNYADDIALDRLANIYVTGYTRSSNFPTLNAWQGMHGAGTAYDAFVLKLVPGLDFFMAGNLPDLQSESGMPEDQRRR
jgi:hypothetical protein